MADGRAGRVVGAHRGSENDFVEPYALRKQRKARELAALKAAASKKPGRPMAIPPGSDVEFTLRRLWNDGTQIKIIAEELGVSIRAVKDARLRLKLKTRRPDLGKGTQLRVAIDSQTMKLLRAACTRKGCTKASHIRELIRRDAGVSS